MYLINWIKWILPLEPPNINYIKLKVGLWFWIYTQERDILVKYFDLGYIPGKKRCVGGWGDLLSSSLFSLYVVFTSVDFLLCWIGVELLYLWWTFFCVELDDDNNILWSSSKLSLTASHLKIIKGIWKSMNILLQQNWYETLQYHT